MTRLLLVRHGQSEWNADGRWQGRADPPLTPLGRTQARSAATTLPAFDVLASSTLKRAHHTAQEIASVHGVADIVTDARLVERDLGAFSGLTRSEIDERFPGYLDNGQRPPGWEQDEDLLDRVRAGLAELVQQNASTTTVVITHGGVIYALERSFGLPHARIANLGGRWFGLDNGSLTMGERVHLLDEASETLPGQL